MHMTLFPFLAALDVSRSACVRVCFHKNVASVMAKHFFPSVITLGDGNEAFLHIYCIALAAWLHLFRIFSFSSHANTDE